MVEWNFRGQYIERSSLDTLHFYIVDLFRPIHIHHKIPHVSNTTGNQHFRNQPWLSKYSIVSTMHLPCNFYLIESYVFLPVEISKLHIPSIWYFKWFEFLQNTMPLKCIKVSIQINSLISLKYVCLEILIQIKSIASISQNGKPPFVNWFNKRIE